MSRSSKKVNLIESIDPDKIPIRKDTLLTGAYVIELSLESQPDYVWQTFFEQEWKSSLHLWDRKVVIVGEKLLLVTTPTEIGEKIDWVRRMIEAANARVEEFNETQEALKGAEEAEILEKHENIIRDQLRMRLAIK